MKEKKICYKIIYI